MKKTVLRKYARLIARTGARVQKGQRLLCPWGSAGKSTGMDCNFLLQGIFPTQGSNPCHLCLLH